MRWLRRRRARRPKPVQCEVCGRLVKPKDAVTIRDEGFGSTEFGPGGWTMEATYCKKDAPQEATA